MGKFSFPSSAGASASGASRFIVCTLLAATALLGLTACKEDSVEAMLYGIAPSAGDDAAFFDFDFTPQQATAGSEIAVTVTSKMPDAVKIEALLANSEACHLLSSTGSVHRYTFTMPAEDVVLTADYASAITFAESDGSWGGEIVESKDGEWIAKPEGEWFAGKGETVYVRFSPDPTVKVENPGLTDGTPLEAEDADANIWKFVMPAAPVVVTTSVADNYLAIVEKYDEHSEVIVLDNGYDYEPDYSKHYHQALAGTKVHFVYTFDIGYECGISIVGASSGTDYYRQDGFTFEDEYTGTGDKQKCWAFFMPAEPVTIASTTTERTDYADENFIGIYKGFGITVAGEANCLVKTSDPALTAAIKGNTVFEITYPDDEETTVSGRYSYANNKLSFVQEDCKEYGLEGNVLDDGRIFADIRDIVNDTPENTAFYLLTRNDATFVCASSAQDQRRYLVEIKENGGSPAWYYVDTQQHLIVPAEAAFSKGSSLGEASAAILQFSSEPYAIKYTLENAGGKPTLQSRGDEFGSYTGEGGTLELDGFGDKATFGGETGTYTIEGTVVAVTTESGKELKFNIDKSGKTYSQIIESKEWDGALHYFTQEAKFQLGDSTGNDGLVDIYLDQDFSGEKKGWAKITIHGKQYGRPQEFVSSSGEYIYNASDETLTLTNILQGTVTDTRFTTEKKDIVLNVSADKKTLTFAADRIYSTSGSNRFLYGGDDTVLHCEEQAAATPQVYSAGQSGSPELQFNGDPSSILFTVMLDADGTGEPSVGNAWLHLVANGKDYINCSAPYTADENTHTIAIEGEYGYFSGHTPAKFVFTLSDDKKTLSLPCSIFGSLGSRYIFPLESPSFGEQIMLYSDYWTLTLQE